MPRSFRRRGSSWNADADLAGPSLQLPWRRASQRFPPSSPYQPALVETHQVLGTMEMITYLILTTVIVFHVP